MYDLAAEGAAMAIGALSALSDGNEARSLTQQWARAIYEVQPAGPETTGIHYRSGYNSGESLALWDWMPTSKSCRMMPDIYKTWRSPTRILLRLEVELRWRQ